MATLLLDRTTWDLVIDSANNIAVATDPYARAQDVCSAARLFLGESFYQPDQGVPYMSEILGLPFDVEIMNDALVDAAERVAGVEAAQCQIFTFDARGVTGVLAFANNQIAFSNGLAEVIKV